MTQRRGPSSTNARFECYGSLSFGGILMRTARVLFLGSSLVVLASLASLGGLTSGCATGNDIGNLNPGKSDAKVDVGKDAGDESAPPDTTVEDSSTPDGDGGDDSGCTVPTGETCTTYP